MLKYVFLSTLLPVVVFAGTPSKSLSETPLSELYARPVRIVDAVESDSFAKVDGKQRLARENALEAFFNLLPTLRKSHLSLNSWFREDHISYITSSLSTDELAAFAKALRTINKRLKAESTDLLTVFVGAGPAAVMAKVGKIDREITDLKNMHKDIINYARTKHEHEFDQRYGDEPYSFHLRKVRAVLKRFGFGPKDSILGLKLGSAAWLHDVVEDTDSTYEELSGLFGKEIADIVTGVTKLKRLPGEGQLEQAERTYMNAAKLKTSRILKLADRIANIEEGMMDLFSGHPSKVHKYFDEWPIFVNTLFKKGDAPKMWRHLERLLTDQAYAQNHALQMLLQGESSLGCSLNFTGASTTPVK